MLKKIALTIIILAAGLFMVSQELKIRRLTLERDTATFHASDISRQKTPADSVDQLKTQAGEIEQLKATNADLLNQVNRLQTAAAVQPAPASTEKTSAPRLNLIPVAHPTASTPVDPAATTNQVPTGITAMMKGVMEQQFMGQVSRLTTKLNLTPQQEQTIRDIFMKRAEFAATAAQGVLSGKYSKDEMAQMDKSAPDYEAQIKAVLLPEQLDAYKEFKDDEAKSSARLVANSQVLQMQGVLGLSTEQQDAVYKALYSRTVDQMSGKIEKPPAELKEFDKAMQWEIDQKAKLLENILTPEQLQQYRDMQTKQAKLMSDMLPSRTNK